MKNKKPSQAQLILRHLEKGNKITPRSAAKKPFSCMRLAARINELRKEGHDIETKIIQYRGLQYAQYSLIQ